MSVEFKDLVGKTLASINRTNESITFHTVAKQSRSSQSLVISPILLAEEVTHEATNPPGVVVPEYQDSFTWTFLQAGHHQRLRGYSLVW